MRNELVDFLNHGLLPLVARRRVIERFVGILDELPERGRLHSVLVIGEAGSGKSRLVDHLRSTFRQKGGMPLHLKFYAGMPVSLAILLREALSGTTSLSLPSFSSEPSLGEVVNGVRRIARLRPTILILEDAHLLEAPALAEARMMMDMLVDEGVFLICLGRSGSVGLEPLLAATLIETIELHPFTRDDLSDLWQALFGERPEPRTVESLWTATGGNPLAVRSALRSGVDAGAIRTDAIEGTGEITITDHALLTSSFHKGTRFLTEGMVLGLVLDEQQGALRLAMLGEVFSPEAASLRIDDAEGMVRRLTFKGILAQAVTPPRRIGGSGSGNLPLAFTHTLLHRHLLEQSDPDPLHLLQLLSLDLPLYSFLPLELIGTHIERLVEADGVLMREAIDRLLERAADIFTSVDHGRAQEVLELAKALWEKVEGKIDAGDWLLLRVRLCAIAARLGIKEIYTERFNELLDELDSALAGTDGEEVAPYHFLSFDLRHVSWYAQHQRPMPEALRAEFLRRHDALLEEHPSLLRSGSYINYMQRLAQSGLHDEETMAWLNRRFEWLLDTGLLEPAERENALGSTIPFLLLQFQTPEELLVRKRQLEELEERGGTRSLPLLFRTILFYEDIGDYDTARQRVTDHLIRKYRDYGFLPQAFNLFVLRERLEKGMEGGEVDLSELLRQLARLPSHYSRPAERFVAIYVSNTALMCGDFSTARRILDQFGSDAPPDQTMLQRLTLASNEGIDQVRFLLSGLEREEMGVFSDDASVLLARFLLPEIDSPSSLLPVHQLLQAPPISIRRLSQLYPLFALSRLLLRGRSDFPDALLSDVRQAFRSMATWLLERRLPGFLESLLECYGDLLPDKELRRWKGETLDVLRERREQFRQPEAYKRKLTFFGRIEAFSENDDVMEVRGGRLRTLLGVMAAVPLLQAPPDHREFCYLAAGSDDMLDPEKARKTMNGAVFRLREVLGEDAVLTDMEIPRINADIVRVDLWEANRLLELVEAGLVSGSLAGLSARLEQVLDVVRGEVLFPSLYDPFFEAIREDFESRLRRILLDLVRRLLLEGDLLPAESLLRRACEMMPGDEEIVELLCDALERNEKKGEAVRLRFEKEDI